MELYQQVGNSFLDIVVPVRPVVMQDKIAKEGNLSSHELGQENMHRQIIVQNGQQYKIDNKAGAPHYTETDEVNL